MIPALLIVNLKNCNVLYREEVAKKKKKDVPSQPAYLKRLEISQNGLLWRVLDLFILG